MTCTAITRAASAVIPPKTPKRDRERLDRSVGLAFGLCRRSQEAGREAARGGLTMSASTPATWPGLATWRAVLV